MLFVEYFVALKSHRAISWRCSAYRWLGEFLCLATADPMLNHSCVSKTHTRLPNDVSDVVFCFLLSVAGHKRLLWGKAIGIDWATL